MTHTSPPRAYLVAADIGGTHSRFGLFAAGQTGPELVRSIVCPTVSLRHTEDVLAAARRLQFFDDEVCATDAASSRSLSPRVSEGEAEGIAPALYAFAVAGPLRTVPAAAGEPPEAQACLSNAPLRLETHTMQAAGLHVLLLNDFAAQAWACVSPVGAAALPVQGESFQARDAEPRQPLGVIGAGTGLGMASLVPVGADWLAVCSEGGHSPFAFVDDEEWEYARFVQRQYGIAVVTAEHVLSGAGLERLHHFVSGEKLTAAQISAQYLQGAAGGAQTLPASATVSCAKVSTTAGLFACFYGRACRQWLLTTCCTGGMYVSGGIAARNPVLVRCTEFLQEFYHADAPPWVQHVPLLHLADPLAGLWGAAKVGYTRLAARA